MKQEFETIPSEIHDLLIKLIITGNLIPTYKIGKSVNVIIINCVKGNEHVPFLKGNVYLETGDEKYIISDIRSVYDDCNFEAKQSNAAKYYIEKAVLAAIALDSDVLDSAIPDLSEIVASHVSTILLQNYLLDVREMTIAFQVIYAWVYHQYTGEEGTALARSRAPIAEVDDFYLPMIGIEYGIGNLVTAITDAIPRLESKLNVNILITLLGRGLFIKDASYEMRAALLAPTTMMVIIDTVLKLSVMHKTPLHMLITKRKLPVGFIRTVKRALSEYISV